ncbi:MAG: molybdenum cofactor biosynthesis protein MoaB [Candidatus Brocadia sp. WS118]|nr:MAG: molybdenum cofactor biosynthesis protein MoaB [Candidatus Brocadia sp. WS118]
MDNVTFLKQKLNLDTFADYLQFPLYYEIETVNACNASCKMCTVNKWRESGNPLMSPELFKKMADELIQYKDIVRTINLCRDGEPLMDKNLEGKIAYLKKGGIRHITFSTNAALLTKKRALSLLDCGLDEIMFSIDGLKKETFEKIREGLKFEKIVGNVLQFIKLRDSMVSKLKIRVRMVIQRENVSEVEEWGKYWRSVLQRQDSVHAKNVHSWANKLENYIPVKETGKLSTPCTSTFSTMIIRYNGDVTICPLDYDFKFVNGNINEQDIKDVWHHGAHFKKFRELHLQGLRDEFDFCRGCRLWDTEASKRSFN